MYWLTVWCSCTLYQHSFSEVHYFKNERTNIIFISKIFFHKLNNNNILKCKHVNSCRIYFENSNSIRGNTKTRINNVKSDKSHRIFVKNSGFFNFYLMFWSTFFNPEHCYRNIVLFLFNSLRTGTFLRKILQVWFYGIRDVKENTHNVR